MRLCTYTDPTPHQKVLLGGFYLCARLCYRTLYQPLAGYEPNEWIAYYVESPLS